jgi:magnesium transporter
MLRVYRKTLSAPRVESLTSAHLRTPDIWVSLVSPTPDERALVRDVLGIPDDFLLAPLDPEESPRVETETGVTFLLVDVPHADEALHGGSSDTIPLGIILGEGAIVTVCLHEVDALRPFAEGLVRDFSTAKRARFTLQIMQRAASSYLGALRRIDKAIGRVEAQLERATRNTELIEMLSLSKTLVYFSTSLKANQKVLRRMVRLPMMNAHPEDEDVLEELIIDNEQAIEMTEIYTNVAQTTMDVFASIISNNLNDVMKILTAVSITLAVPTVIGGLFGMNVASIPFAGTPGAFWIVTAIAVVLAMAVVAWFRRRGYF